jgi:DNA-binding transcriptional LysR family regulator
MQHMLHWDDVRLFLALHRCGSHARAAAQLRIDPTTVSRRLSALESTLGATLLERTPSGLVATAAGAQLAERAARVEEELLASERELGGRDGRLEGSVVVTAGDGLVMYLLVPWFAEFRVQHPGITLELRSHKRALDIARREADVAVRLSRPREASLVARRVAQLPFGIYGAEPYFARAGEPRAASELAMHDWIGPDERLAATPQGQWMARCVPPARVRLRANTTAALVAACAAGHGLALLPTFAAAADGRLRALLPHGSALPVRDAWIVTHEDVRKSARVRAVVRFLTARFASFHVEAAEREPSGPGRGALHGSRRGQRESRGQG